MEKAVKNVVKLSHKQFRALLKKFRRKKKRQQLAKERERLELLEQQRRESSPSYQERQKELERNVRLYEEFEERERARQNKLWLLREEKAQEEFRIKKEQQEQEKIRLEEERKRILEEFEKQEFVISEASKEAESVKSQKETPLFLKLVVLLGDQQAERLQAALSELAEKVNIQWIHRAGCVLRSLKEDGPWHNPIAPESYNAGIERDTCMFFSKTGCCRFGDRCSRGHLRPDVSRTILIRGMYSHFSLSQTASDDYDADIALEYTDRECYQHFKNFYEDVLPEFKKFGKVLQFKVCNNYEPHLRGNVYIQYSSEHEAMEAYKNFNGRYYAGRQLTCEFTNISRWKAAICGLFAKRGCPKGENCNFLHVFRNPDNEFWHADRDLPPDSRDYHSHSSRHGERGAKYHHRSSDRSRHEPHSERYDSRSDRHKSRHGRYEPRSERYESRHQSRSERSESKYESRSERSESRYDSRSERSSSKYESKNERHDASYYRDESAESDSPRGNSPESSDCHSSKHKKRKRDSHSRSRSPSELSNGKQSHKKKKHKTKSKKKKKNSSEEENSAL